MPLYEFDCPACSRDSESPVTKEILVRSPTEKPVCPDCGSDQLDRLMSATAAPATGNRSLPMSGGSAMGESCAAPRCCGGGCQI